MLNRRHIGLYLGLSIAWGIPYLLIRICLDELSPIVIVWARTGLGALILLPVALAYGWLGPVLRRWPQVVVLTVIEVSIPWFLISRAELHLTSSVTGLLIAAVPIVGVAVATMAGQPQRLGTRGWSGLLLALVGVAAVVGLDLVGNQLSSVVDMAIVVVCYAIGSVLLSLWFGHVRAIAVIAVALALAAVGYTPFALQSLPTHWPSQSVLLALAGLTIVSTAAGFVMFAALITAIGPVRATTVTAVNPAVAVAAGAIFLNERISPLTVAGFALIAGGSLLVNTRSTGA
jgi:drug/metabolite transporter (DMT)-like permease